MKNYRKVYTFIYVYNLTVYYLFVSYASYHIALNKNVTRKGHERDIDIIEQKQKFVFSDIIQENNTWTTMII